jgi:hypothetical protein
MSHKNDDLLSRRKFLSSGVAVVAGGAFILSSALSPSDQLCSRIGLVTRGQVEGQNDASNLYCVEGYPHLVGGTHVGLERLLGLMGGNGLCFFRSRDSGVINGPDGLIAANDLVLIKINCQWGERGGTNTDLLRALIHKITEHPDGFIGEIVVVDNGQGRGSFNWQNANADDTTQSAQDVVDSFGSQGISTFLWDNIRAIRVSEYDQGSIDDGYVLDESAEPSTGMKFNYPKFKTRLAKYVSLRKGIWDPQSNSYSDQKLKLINVPVLKSHSGAGVTACIKHYMGFVSQSMQDNHPYIWNGGLAAEMAQVRFPTLNVLDATYINPHPKESGNSGPDTPYSNATYANRIIAGLDPIAIDYWASKNVLLPAAQSLGYSSYSSMDPDNTGQIFHNYLARSTETISAAGIQATMDASRINVYRDQCPTGSPPCPTVWRASNGYWLVRYQDGSSWSRQWGASGDVPLVGDVDGDGAGDLIVWRPSNGYWYVLNSTAGYSSSQALRIQWGTSGDVPLVGDVDGDGRVDLIVWRPSNGYWYVLKSTAGYSSSQAFRVQWGMLGDTPLVGDVDGDGLLDLIVWRPSNGYWYVLKSSTGYDRSKALRIQWGTSGDTPLVGRFDNDALADLIVWRPTTGMWYVLKSSSGYDRYQAFRLQWGTLGDTPSVGDVDGDGLVDFIVWRPSNGYWYTLKSTTNYDRSQASRVQWGTSTDKPLVPGI